jgi:uncharacterized DUF497 family protein
VEFEWDTRKAGENLRKFGATASDPDHSVGENRYTVGSSNRGRLLMVAHVERREHIRIISARELTRSEKRAYEETQK